VNRQGHERLRRINGVANSISQGVKSSMAEELAIRGSNEAGKVRGYVSVALLIIVTLGIYGIVYYYKVNKELAELGKARGTEELGTSPGTSVLAVTLGALIIVPALVSHYHTWKRQQKAREMFGVTDGMEAGLGFILALFISPVAYYFFLSGQNSLLRAQANA
jgi:Domain of unknown function (DUF4234)